MIFLSKGIYRLTLFVNSQCNFNCVHCFYPRELSGCPLTSEEVLRIFEKSDIPLRILTISGGEPFLKEDLSELVKEILSLHQKVFYINFVTNGYFVDKVVNAIEELVAAKLHIKIGVQVSLYGFQGTQKRISGVDSFEQVISTIDALSKIDCKRLQVSVMSVIIDQDSRELEELNLWIKDRYKGRVIHKVEVMRDLSFVKKCDIQKSIPLYQVKIKNNQYEKYIELIKKWSGGGGIIREKRQRYLRNLLIRTLQNRPFYFNCAMGKYSAVLLSNGDVPVCEYSKSYANVRDFDYDLSKLWNSPDFRLRADKIKGSFCFHPCAVTDSVFNNINLIGRFLLS